MYYTLNRINITKGLYNYKVLEDFSSCALESTFPPHALSLFYTPLQLVQ